MLEIKQPTCFDTYDLITSNEEGLSFFVPPDPLVQPPEPLREPLERELVTDKPSPRDLQRSLVSLERKTTRTFMDTGLWVLYLGFGVLRWKLADKPSEPPQEALSPLLLVPVELVRESPREPYLLRRTEGDLVLNPTLQVKLQNEFGIALPALADLDDVDLGELLMSVRNSTSGWPDWSVEESVILSTFSFHKEAMWRDLLDNEAAVSNHAIVNGLALGSKSTANFDFSLVPEEKLDEVMPPEDLVCILDADSSQRQCIKAAIDGRSFVMDGPPGTGKSQTIANIIAEVISRGRSVLFVSEKAAALEVVQTRLAHRRLGDYLLALHSNKTTRKDLALELGKSLRSQPQVPPKLAGTSIAQLRQRRKELGDYAMAVNEARPPLGRSLHWAYGRIAQFDHLPHLPWWDGSASDLTEDKFAHLVGLGQALSRAWGPIERRDRFYWRDIVIDDYSMQVRHSIESQIVHAIERLQILRSEAGRNADAIGLGWAAELGRQSDLLELLSHLDARRRVPIHWISNPRTSELQGRINSLRDEWNQVAESAAQLEEMVGANWRQVDPASVSKWRGAVEAYEASAGVQINPAANGEAFNRAFVAAQTISESAPVVRDLAAQLQTAFGEGQVELTLGHSRALGELGMMMASDQRPEAEWFNPLVLPTLGQAAQILGNLVKQYRERRNRLSQLFTDRVLELDLETLCLRFEQVYRGPFKFLKSGYRADRRQLAAATRLGRVDRTILSSLRDALEWKQLTDQLDQAEIRHASSIGSHYYQRDRSDLEALDSAISTAHRAVELAGKTIAVNALVAKLSRTATGDPDLYVAATRLDAELKKVNAAQGILYGTSSNPMETMVISDLGTWATGLGPPLVVLQEVHAALALLSGRSHTFERVESILEKRAWVSKKEAELAKATPADTQLLGPAYLGPSTDWIRLSESVEWADKLTRILGPVTDEGAIKILNSAVARKPLEEANRLWGQALLDVTSRFTASRQSAVSTWFQTFESAQSRLDDLANTTADIDEWLSYQKLTTELESAGLGGTVAAAEAHATAKENVPGCVERGLVEGWADSVAKLDPRLNEVRRVERDRIVDEFRTLDVELIQKSSAKVIESCNARRPATGAIGQAAIIAREASKKRRHMPIRKLLGETAEVAQALKPCFMMSPLSVSQFLSPDMRFDLVIFDEASQVRPSDAINCIYRGKQLIVAGDEKQLPPTSFFEVSTGDVEDEYNEDELDEFDSVLKLCKGSATFRDLSLRWHYRSQHEGLIAFSNRSFYDSSLFTFPGALTVAADLGIEVFKVAGVYRARTGRDNPVEAAKVAERVIFHAANHPSLTLGVVTFSDAQEETVLAAIDRARQNRPDLDRFFSKDRLNGFFVKNLESVQGDERDVIIFSIGYGPDQDGRFSLQLGPLTKQGGERRLNVAVTRARRRVEIVTSVTSADFRGEMAPGGGVFHLRNYLNYAEEQGSMAERPAPTGQGSDSPLEEEILRVIRSWGYDADPQVGTASYRVDIGVRERGDQSRYLVGVECDGVMYHSSRVARDRDRLRHRVLTDLGWRLHRIWSPSWNRDRRGEEARLKSAIEAALASPASIPERREETIEHETVSDAVILDASNPTWTSPYKRSHPPAPTQRLDLHLPEVGPAIQRAIMKVAEDEAPISVELLLTRVREAWAVGRSGHRIVENFGRQLDELARRKSISLKGTFVWLPKQTLSSVRVPDHTDTDTVRRVDQVPPEEIELAIGHLADDSAGASEDEISEAAARLFGWRRRGPDISLALSKRIERMVSNGLLSRRGEALRWTGPPFDNRALREVLETLPVEEQIQSPDQFRSERPAEPAPVATAEHEIAEGQRRHVAIEIPTDIHNCLTPAGHRERTAQLSVLEAKLNGSGDPGDQRRLEAQVSALRRQLHEARILPVPSDNAVVRLGSKVTFRENEGSEESYVLVGPMEADISTGKISLLSPLGQALHGRALGDVVRVQAQQTSYEVTITAISTA